MNKDRLVSGEEDMKVSVAAIATWTEGPTADREGNIYFTDVIGNRIMKLGVDGRLSAFCNSLSANHPNGMVIDPEGRLLVCEEGDPLAGLPPRITRTDLRTGFQEVLADHYEGRRFGGPNDITFDSSGRIYFTDGDRPVFLLPYPETTGIGVPTQVVETTGVYRIDLDGGVTRILARPDIQRPNGLMISPDDRTLYLIENDIKRNGLRRILAYDLMTDGSVTNVRLFYDFGTGRSGDGMTVDSEGNLYVCAGLNAPRGTDETLENKAGLYIFNPSGKKIGFIPIPEDSVTNVTFAGPDLTNLYITAGKTLYMVRGHMKGTIR
ncbi:SMP-30/gluconolactonase/LRE family protein [Paenibacillus sp. P25]|nr:SMP-30/gluconolactonase/LRE family protein [Paenibacillus sp. P25]